MKIKDRRTGRALSVAAVVCAVSVLPACAAHSNAAPAGTMTMPDGTVMSNSQMSAMPGMTNSTAPPGSASNQAGGPSSSAKMICTDETAGAVRRNLTLASAPTRSAHWADQTYTCDYALPGGSLTLSVKDLTSTTAGQAWFDGLRSHLPAPATIKGIANLGFPSFETNRGDVVFLKDGKTLWVNATQVPTKLIPPGSTRTGVAYGVAAAVIACWKG